MESGTKKAVRTPPALNPEQVAVVQPWKEYLSLGLITSLRVEIKPNGTLISMDVSERVSKENNTDLAPGQAKQLILSSGLLPKKEARGKGSDKQVLPVRSLCAKDFEDPDGLPKRLKQVADKLGPSTALGRIGSLKYHIEGAKSFEEWWSAAEPSKKARLVMDLKHFEDTPEEAVNNFFDKVPSPFRGPFPDAQKNDKEEPKKTEAQPAAAKSEPAKAGPSKAGAAPKKK